MLESIDTPAAQAILCIDNSSAILALGNNADDSEPARKAIQTSTKLVELGWNIHTLWTPAHVGILGNETADTLAKSGAGEASDHYVDASTTKTWLYAEAKRILLRKWQKELPSAHASLSYPSALKNVKWSESRAQFRVYCNRTPSDPFPSDPPSLCLCGEDTVSGRHLFASCPLYAHSRGLLRERTFGDIHSDDYILDPRNYSAIIKFLRKTGIGFSDNPRPDNSDSTDDEQASEEDSLDELDVGDFE